MSDQANSPAAAQAQPAAPKASRKTRLAVAAIVFLALAAGYGAYYMGYGQYSESTDDAYVGANLVYVQAQAPGTVIALGADDNQPVQLGQTLVKLDGADASVALADAEARLGETVRQIRAQFRSVDAAEAVVAQRKTDLQRATDDLARRQPLAGSDALAAEDLDHARQAVAAAKDALAVAQKQLDQARVPVAGTTLSHQPSVMRARAAYVQAYLALQRNLVPAPVAGYVARRSVQLGQRIAAGAPLMAVVPLQGAWVDANFKEPQLRHIRVGQPASVSVDLYGGKVEYHGHVVSIAPGSGAAFSLLPPQNATGNWIKVVQRVPVRIALDPGELQKNPLRVGLSSVVEIDTHDRNGRADTAESLPNATLSTPVFDGLLAKAEAQADAVVARESGAGQ